MKNYEIWLCHTSGHRIAQISNEAISLQYAKKVNGTGWMNLTMPGEWNLSALRPDRQIQIWRTPQGGKQGLDFLCYISKWTVSTKNGFTTTIISGEDQNTILKRRVVAYPSGDAKAYAAGVEVDDLMKLIVTNNMGSGAEAARDISDSGFTIEGNKSEGGQVHASFSWKNCMKVLRELNEISRADGQEVFFDVRINGVSANFIPILSFSTYIGQPGLDRTKTANPKHFTMFSDELDNLLDPVMVVDYTESANYIYTGGVGQGTSRTINEKQDTSLKTNESFGRREHFKDARGDRGHVQWSLDDTAKRTLTDKRRTIKFKGKVVDTPTAAYGIHWGNGYKVTVSVYGTEFDALIRSVKVSVLADGTEKIESVLEGEFND